MKKLVILALCAATLSSCGVQRKVVMPSAVNTINMASLADLNLERSDYEVLNTIEAEASITCSSYTNSRIEMESEDGEFSLKYLNGKSGWDCYFRGIARLGYLQADYADTKTDIMHPHEVVRRLAIYRLINIAKEYGADAVIEPTIATNIEQVSRKDVVYKTTVTAKIIKIKTDR